MPFFRGHLKYNHWSVFYGPWFVDDEEPDPQAVVLRRIRRDQEVKLRTWVPVVSIVNADEISTQQQIEQDADAPDALELLDLRTPEEIVRDTAARQQQDEAMADRIMHLYDDVVMKQRWLERCAAKRAEQLRDDLGQYREGHHINLNEEAAIEAEHAEIVRKANQNL